MTIRHGSIRLACYSAALLAITACGGGGGDSTATTPALVATTTNVSTKVIDGAIQNAVVCLDKNVNGKCDTDEVQGKTDATGAVTLAVPNADVGKYPLIAVVGTNAIDADHGAVTQAYTMSAPADQVGVVSPLTTLVQQTVATTGASTTEAAKSVQLTTGISASLFQDFTTGAAPTDGSVSAATVARMLVVTTQQQSAAVASTVGTTAIDGAAITQADIDKAIQKKLLEILPALITALSDPTVQAATTPAAKELALAAAAAALITDSGLTPASVATVVAINNQTANAAPTTATPPAAAFTLNTLTFTDAQNFFYRVVSLSLAQNTPDASSNIRWVDRRVRSAGGNVAKWGPGSEPARGTDLHWNGSAWVNCPTNFENTVSVRDAQGNAVYNFCDNSETGKSNLATFDIGGKTMASVYAQVRAAGYTNLTITDPAVLGTDTFPTGSALQYFSNTALTEAIAYYPGGAHSQIGTSNLVTQFSAAVSGGGTASTQASDAACNSTEANTSPGVNSTTLEGLIALKRGTPCIYNPSSFVYAGVTYSSGDTNEWWSNSTLSLGKLGTAPIGSGAAPGFYTANTPLRVAFTGSGTNEVTYYACKERFNNGSVRNCTGVGKGTYTISTLGNARAMTFNNLPAQTGALNYNRVFVERGGLIYFGYQSKPGVTNSARLTTKAASALITTLGLPIEDPSVPLVLTAGSYQGTWDFHQTALGVTSNNGITLYFNANGGTVCEEHGPSRFFACTLAITNPATGAFALTMDTDSITGTINFLAGTANGLYHDTTAVQADALVVGGRR